MGHSPHARAYAVPPHLLVSQPMIFNLIMTRKNTPFQPRLDEQSRRKTLAYIHKCEQKGETSFQDFEKQIRDFVDSLQHYVNSPGRAFTHTFVEYVMYEITLQNVAFLNKRTLVQTLADRRRLFFIRRACKLKHGASPEHHATYYHNFVNELLIEEGEKNEFVWYREQWYLDCGPYGLSKSAGKQLPVVGGRTDVERHNSRQHLPGYGPPRRLKRPVVYIMQEAPISDSTKKLWNDMRAQASGETKKFLDGMIQEVETLENPV